MVELKSPWLYRRHDVVAPHGRAARRRRTSSSRSRAARSSRRCAPAPGDCACCSTSATAMSIRAAAGFAWAVGLRRPARVTRTGTRAGAGARPRDDRLHGQRRGTHARSCAALGRRRDLHGSSGVGTGRPGLVRQAEQLRARRPGSRRRPSSPIGSAAARARPRCPPSSSCRPASDAHAASPSRGTCARRPRPRRARRRRPFAPRPRRVSGRTSSSTRSPRRSAAGGVDLERHAVVVDRARRSASTTVALEPVHRADELRHERRRRARRTSRPACRSARSGPSNMHGDAVGDRERLLLVVRDVDRRDPELELDPADLLAQLHAHLRVERRERLVEQQQPRLDRERARQRDPLLHAARELVRIAIGGVRRGRRARAARAPSPRGRRAPLADLAVRTRRCGTAVMFGNRL